MNFVDVKNDVDDEGLKAAYQDANRHSWTKDELAAYDYAAMREQDERGKIELAEKRSQKRTQFEIAKEMMAQGEPVEKIKKYTGLTDEEIQGFLML